MKRIFFFLIGTTNQDRRIQLVLDTHQRATALAMARRKSGGKKKNADTPLSPELFADVSRV